jgi:hypothetical protein
MTATLSTTSERRTSVVARPCAGGQAGSVVTGAVHVKVRPGASTIWSATDRRTATPSAFGRFGSGLDLGLGLAAMHAQRTAPVAARTIAVRTIATETANAPKAMAYPTRRPPDTSSH